MLEVKILLTHKICTFYFYQEICYFFFFFQTEWMGFECVIDMDDFDPYFLS